MKDEYSDQKALLKEKIDVFFDQIALIKKAHFDFLEHGILPPHGVIADDIMESWKRSISIGLDPSNLPRLYCSNRVLRDKLDANSDLISTADPVLTEFSVLYSSEFFSIDLYDSEMVLLKRYSLLNKVPTSDAYIRPGLIRSEEVAGCTSMSIALSRDRCAQTIGGEHFNNDLVESMCTAAPIHINGKVVGFINVRDRQLKENKDIIDTLTILSRLIEQNHDERILRNQLRNSAAVSSEVLAATSNGVLIVNSDEIITVSNPTACKLLEVPENRLKGMPLTEVFGQDNPISTFIQTEQKPIKDKEITLTVYGKMKRFLGNIQPISQVYGGVVSYLIVLRDFKHVRKIVQSVGGWNAKSTFDDIIGDDPDFKAAVNFAKETARLGSNTLIIGKSGTGKELFASSIHNASEFSRGPFVPVNCGSIPANLLESELFGYEGGAFTGSRSQGQMGKFELAEGGTIFLDEIDSIPLDMQVKLLRVLQEKTICRVGGTTNIELHLKIIAATNENLMDLVSRGRFRADLFYRLNAITIHIPSLNQHPSDIPAISRHVISRLSQGSDREMKISDNVFSLLMAYPWPGNIRELENAIERGMINAQLRGSDTITVQDMPEFVPTNGKNQYMPAFINSSRVSTADPEAAEKSVISDALQRYNYNLSAVSRELGMARNTLYKRIKKYGLDKK